VCDAGEHVSKVGRRDLAILTVLIRLGLRTAEVAGLGLDDIDWRRDACPHWALTRGVVTQVVARRHAEPGWAQSWLVLCQQTCLATPCDLSMPTSWDDVVRSMVLKSSVWGPHSLHTAKVTDVNDGRN
jgi:hypothetical protein